MTEPQAPCCLALSGYYEEAEDQRHFTFQYEGLGCTYNIIRGVQAFFDMQMRLPF